MEHWTRSGDRNSLDSIGLAYDEDEASPGTAERARRVHVETPDPNNAAAAPPHHFYDRDWSPTDDATTDTTGFTSSSRQISNLIIRRHDDETVGFTYRGAPADVVCFRSCISYHTHSNRHSRNVTPPEQSGPFGADVLCVILLFIPVDMREILHVSHTCRFWRFYANYAPHWTYYRRLDWSKRIKDLPKYIRKVVVKPKIVTQQEYFRERIKVREAQRREVMFSRVRHIRWCIAIAVLSAAAGAANFVVSYFLGYLPTVLRTDETLAGVNFVLMITMVVLEVAVVIVPLGGASTPSQKNNMMHLLSWGLFLLCVSCIFGTMSALAMARVQSNDRILDSPTLDLTMDAECTAILRRADPSFAYLPAPLLDVRWRQLTMDDTEKTFIPYCIAPWNNISTCYVLLFFDAAYRSPAFNGSLSARKVGTRTAIGFDPIGNTTGAWCAVLDRPQVVGITEPLYKQLEEERDQIYPSDVYDNPAARPVEISALSYQCSVAYNRVATESPVGSTRPWYDRGLPWRRHYIPLLVNSIVDRDVFLEEHTHYLRYASVSYIVPSILWLVMLIGQCITKNEALIVLGITTTVVLFLMNPFVLILSGVLCVKLSDHYFMCSASSGGSMIGGGIGITAILAAIYVCFS